MKSVRPYIKVSKNQLLDPSARPWDEWEKAALVCGLFLHGKDFSAIQQLVQTRQVRVDVCNSAFRNAKHSCAVAVQVHECVEQYYRVFKHSVDHKKWKDAVGRWGVKGNSFLSGRKQSRLLAELFSGAHYGPACLLPIALLYSQCIRSLHLWPCSGLTATIFKQDRRNCWPNRS
jgi:hypothetical protein